MTSYRFMVGVAAAMLMLPWIAAAQHHSAPPPGRTAAAPPHAGDRQAVTEQKRTGRKATIELTEATRVGGTLLAPGHYRVQMQREGNQHVLVLALQKTVHGGPWHYGTGAGREVLRVACDLTDGGDKNRQTAFYLRKDADGVPAFSGIRIKGERGNHRIPATDTL